MSLSLLLSLLAPAHATDVVDESMAISTANQLAQDQEDQSAAVLKELEKRLETRVRFEAEYHEYDNLDFRPLDESNDQAIEDSDDRGGFAYTGISLGIGYQVTDDLRFNMGASHRGLWGQDQIGGTGMFGGFVYFTDLNVQWTPADFLTLTLGRQFFTIGGETGSRDYILRDVIDAVRVDLDFGVGRVVVIPIDVFTSLNDHEDIDFVTFMSRTSVDTSAFRGDVMTRRHGGMVELDRLVDGLDVRAYGFYTDIGAAWRGTGADITYNGRLGNFADGDWVANYGLRASYQIAGMITPYAGFHGSLGIDRKEVEAQDVNTEGIALEAGVTFDNRDENNNGLWATAGYFNALGAAYSADGLLYSHGYVGMKGQEFGGVLMDRYLGMHPSAYVGMFGIDDTQHAPNRKSGTQVVKAQVAYQADFGLLVRAGWWSAWDTGISFAIENGVDIDDMQLPFGYSRTEIYAQERLGKLLGHEADLTLGWQVNEAMLLQATGAVMLPGEFYGITVGRIASQGSDTQLGGSATAWSVSGGTRVNF